MSRGEAIRGRLPSRGEALRMLEEAGCPPGVVEHCKAVASLALNIARACLRAGKYVNLHLVEVGALIHDIGRSRTHSVAHAFIGAELARGMNLDERLVRVILSHLCGVGRDLAEGMGWLPGPYEPRTLEEKIIAYADKLVKKARVTSFEEALRELVEELGPRHPTVMCFVRVREELLAVLGGELDACCRLGKGLRPS